MDTVGVSDSSPLVSTWSPADSLADVSVLLDDGVALVSEARPDVAADGAVEVADVADDSADSLAAVDGDVVSGVVPPCSARSW